MRLAGWRGRLAAHIAKARQEPFAYGALDCMLFAAGAVEAVTGDDIAGEYRGRYTTYEGGIKLLRRNGLMDHVDLFAAHFEKIDSTAMVIGDVAVIATDNGPALGISQGSGLIFAMSMTGMEAIDMTDPRVTSAFRIE